MGNCQSGTCPSGNCPGGELSVGELSVGELSGRGIVRIPSNHIVNNSTYPDAVVRKNKIQI